MYLKDISQLSYKYNLGTYYDLDMNYYKVFPYLRLKNREIVLCGESSHWEKWWDHGGPAFIHKKKKKQVERSYVLD